jgi:NitT/TauT family transport system permease protein
MYNKIRKIYSIILLLVIWELVTRLGKIDEILLPSVSSIILELVKLIQSGEIFVHIKVSLFRSLSSFFLAVIIGIPAGICIGWYRYVEDFFEPIIAALYPIPKIALLPLLLLYLGIGYPSQIGIIFLACIFPIVINTYSGVKSIDRVYLDAAKSMGSTQIQILFKIVFPASLPFIFVGLRLSLALSLIVLFAAEMVAANNGLGFLILFSEQTFNVKGVFTGILVIGFLGFVFEGLLKVIRDRVLYWYYEKEKIS